MGLFRTRTEPTTPLEGIDAVFADLDGVVYAGAGSIPHAVESLNRTKAERPRRVHHEQRIAQRRLGRRVTSPSSDSTWCRRT